MEEPRPYSASAAPACAEFDEQRQLLAGRDLLCLFHDHRMIGNGLFELAVDLERFVLVAVAREEAAIGLDVAHRDRVRLVGPLVALGGIFFVVGEIEDQSSMHVLEDRVPVRPGEPVERVDRRMRIAGAGIGPGREQGSGEISDRTADRLREILPRQRILLLLERAHAEHKPRDPIAAVDLH